MKANAAFLRESDQRRMLERVPAQEEGHATDMHDLWGSHQGRPMLEN